MTTVLAAAELADVPLAWPVEGSTVLGHGHIADFRQDQIRTPDGSLITREYLQHPGAVAVIALDAEERVALVRQYRHPVRHRLVEPPAGLLDVDGEDYLAAVQRELAEEVDLAAGEWHVLVDQFSTPGIVGESVRVYLARDLRGTAAPDGFVREGEEADMDVVWAPLSDLVDAVLAGRLHNPSLVSGVLAAEAARSRGWASLRPADAPWPAREHLVAATRR
ncbi:ADP-ribose pyrophosphatase [Friedmanniella luteola]|uniref:ADP-ribose pyrophosphatase n=1 Tax=Friedmanniella luteola TaxID=546871 RepID=A0A1H1QV77_9ACTN|nr:NUDIX hydrolase [Friedmanniella luteola]SDS27421.1 ADP-ribose pyrophosphatase [Friedmanniella luteola]